MTRQLRIDEPDTWHHVMNRGIARRPIFESRTDVRKFLAGLARAVRAGSIEVHAFCVMTTHFHLLVRSPEGRLPEVMQRVQNDFSRWYNRSRRRDGPLFRGRYRSRRAQSEAYRRILVYYIDNNPVEAGIVTDPIGYPHGSARRIAEGRGAPWLSRDWIGCATTECLAPDSSATDESGAWQRTIARIAMAPPAADDALDDLIEAAPARVRAWMIRKSQLADGTIPGIPVCTESAVAMAIRAWRPEVPAEELAQVRALHIGLLREMCGTTLAESAKLVGVSVDVAKHSYARYRSEAKADGEFLRVASELATAALRRGHPARTVPGTVRANELRSGR